MINAAKNVIQFCPTTFVDVPQLRDSKDHKILAAAVAESC